MRCLTAALCLSIGWGQLAAAGDWPQILGPSRNGIAQGETLASEWPKAGPATVWQRRVGSGNAGVAVAGGVCVLFHRVGDNELVEAMRADTGDVLWKQDYPTGYLPSVTPNDGPLAVPLIHGNRVYVFGSQGGLRCLDLFSGKRLWARNTHSDYRALEGYFGAGSSPIVEDGKLIVNVGGARTGAGIVAFNLDDGSTVWKATDEQASYSSPVAVTVDGVRHLIFVTRLTVTSLDPSDGSLRFQFEHGATGPTVNGASPVVLGDKLFVTSSYHIGAVFAQLGRKDATILWRSDDVLSSQFATPIEHGGKLFGFDGRQDVGVARVRCIDPQTESVLWTQDDFGYGTMVKADNKLIIMTTAGDLVLAEANPQRYKELARAHVLDSTVLALPALAQGKLYVRDETQLKCLSLR